MPRPSLIHSAFCRLIIVALSLRWSAFAAPTINVALQASFHSAPYLLELLETAAEENSTAYFPLLDRVADGHFSDCTTDLELHTTFLQTVQDDGHITNPEALASLQFALSIHSAAPRIEAHYQYYAESVEPSLMVAQDAACPVWVHFDGKQYCSATLERAQQDVDRLKHPEQLPFDRVLGENSGKTSPPSILYADITSPLFSQFHQTISSTARNGQTSYRVRYRPAISTTGRPLSMNGYGVELSLKRTDYIVIDDRGDDKKEQEPEIPNTESEEVVLGNEELADLKPLSTSELRGLGLKTASFVMSSEDPFGTLIKISQDFPKHSSAITKRNVSTELLTEHRANREIMLPAGYNVIWMNGMQVEARQMDAFALLERMRRERSLIGSLRDVGFSGLEAVQLLSHPSIAESKIGGEEQRYDYRDVLEGGQVIIWLNDIEKDKRYQDWPTSNSALLQRTYPGQLPSLRRNVHSAVIPLDVTDMKDAQLLVESLQMFVKRKIPIRFGIVPTLATPASQDQTKVMYHLLDTYGIGAVLTYLEASLQAKKITKVDPANFESTVQERKVRRDRSVLSLQAVLDDSELRTRVEAGQRYLERLGVSSKTPPVFVNGVAVPRNEGWLQAMSTRVDQDLRSVQRQIFEETISEDAQLSGLFLEKAAINRNALIIPEDESAIQITSIGDLMQKHGAVYENLPRIPRGTEGVTENLPATLLVVANLDSDEGSSFAETAVHFSRDNPDVEIAFLHNPIERASYQPSIVFFKYGKKEGWNMSADMVQTILTLKQVLIKQNRPIDLGYSEDDIEASETFWRPTQPIVEAIGLRPGEKGLVLSGRVVGPIPAAMNFTKDEYSQLLNFERSKRLKPAMTALQGLKFESRIDSAVRGAIVSSAIALSTVSDLPESIFESAPPLRMAQFDQWSSTHTMISTGDADAAFIHLVASIDPTSELAQRWIPMLKVLSELNGVYLRLFLNPRESMEELPIKRFYRHVLDAAPSFTDDGARRDLQATFEGVPKEALLNLALDVPPAWLVAPKESVYDLDNIKLSGVKDGSNIDAMYELENILIEGHSRDVTTGPPPRGVQLLLGTEKNPYFADTIIMANLGYFQFKANPGYWKIQLKSGRSSQIFRIDSAGQKGYSPQAGDESTDIALISFQGKTLYPRLSRQPGREEDDVLEEGSDTAGKAMDYLSKAARFASSILSSTGVLVPSSLQAPPSSSAQAEINIFSVASGHLYERMLNIMMVSVMRHTTHTVKFWFIEQFLSPSFKASLPRLAAHYRFAYALVTYKWPHWLRAQAEKQRQIWGYKILFLDVLFPLDLDKVIFVDADQIVRTDMHDLVTLDLDGAPYAFTPMCDSRVEMEGFRFWKHGYWQSFLRGLPYHISALYAVDLRVFRALAAGDRLRQQYHALSADPGSLSNLDQDLPNHMQHVLPIKSLDQSWLWCETWCADAALADARTIDLCNNPLTKEPKLERARRQVPEWTVYDEEIAAVLRGDEVVGQHMGASEGERREGEGVGVVEEGNGKKKKVRDEL
ncbi:MAG: hypothetical protein LQ344_000480 [Seirophora lacunosa]|nr:MAG: hypothetical protein LQ344_000480 [Seirophora lacunosa]